MEIYLRHLKDDGVIAVHISNDYLNLAPVLIGLAEEFGLAWAFINTPGDRDAWKFTSQWMLLTTNRRLLESNQIAEVASETREHGTSSLLWTDDFNNLLQILK